VVKTSELIAQNIILDIARRGLTRGDPLPPEASMLEYYQVGRASLREALRLLEVNGLVTIRPGAKGGPVVGAANSEHLGRMMTLYFGLGGATYDHLSQVMLILYPMVAEVAARRKLTKQEKKTLEDAVEHACGVPDPRLLEDETLKDFHYLLAELSRNPVWMLLADAVGAIFSDHIMSTADSSEFHATAADDHREIAEAVIAGDAERSAQAMRDHTERMIKFYRAQNPGIFSQLIEWR
jgi:DNA-binding FadR family transcriptional regulator